MKNRIIYLAVILLAGCSSMPAGKGGDQTQADSRAPATYHHETVSEFNEGESKFLRLVPDKEP